MTPVTALQVVAVRYHGTRFNEGDARALDAYAATNVYAAAGVPYTLVEPRFPEAQRVADEPTNLGLLGDQIARAVADGLRAGRQIVLSGGNCSHITGVVGGLQDEYGPAARIGLVWFDAHGDFNTPGTTLSGMLGGMPVAVAAGLAYPGWRAASHIAAPLPTDRILLVDVRNLDPAEATLIHATDAQVVAVPGQPGNPMAAAVSALADRCDLIYLHVDSDILDETLVPTHTTREPDGPDMAQVQAAIDLVMATGKVIAYAVVSVGGEGEAGAVTVASGTELLRGGLAAWKRHGTVG